LGAAGWPLQHPALVNPQANSDSLSAATSGRFELEVSENRAVKQSAMGSCKLSLQQHPRFSFQPSEHWATATLLLVLFYVKVVRRVTTIDVNLILALRTRDSFFELRELLPHPKKILANSS
jgi:hypothetical protein